MIVFIDDSGDPGFKTERGSSAFFVIACIIFNDELEAERCALAIKELRRTLGFPDNMEFKFNKSRKDMRLEFLKTITKYDFKIRTLVVNKSVIRSQELRNNKNSFYSYTIKSVLQYSKDSIKDAKVRIDGSGDRLFKKSFLLYLRKHLGKNKSEVGIMKNCRLIDSRSNVLIQMADMVAGSIKRHYENNKPDSSLYRELIKKKIEDEWRFR